jgi:hypothetical protein
MYGRNPAATISEEMNGSPPSHLPEVGNIGEESARSDDLPLKSGVAQSLLKAMLRSKPWDANVLVRPYDRHIDETLDSASLSCSEEIQVAAEIDFVIGESISLTCDANRRNDCMHSLKHTGGNIRLCYLHSHQILDVP